MELHHVGLAVADLFAEELFYRRVFGFAPAYRHASREAPRQGMVVLERGPVRLELSAACGAAAAGGGVLSLAVDDLEAERARLRALGVAAEDPRETDDGLRVLSLRDPEGNLVELCARVRPAPREEIAAVIFDLDGTLVDSEGNYYEADRILLAERGVALTPEIKAQYVGRSNQEVLAAFRERFGLAEPVERLVARKNELYLELARDRTQVFPKMAEFARRLAAMGLPLAVASGTSPGVLGPILGQTGLAPLFRVALSAEGGRSKPAPDVFLEAAQRLGTEPRRCLVIEDSQYGVEAAKRAFMTCIAVPFLAPPPLPDAFSMADLLFAGGMEQFEVERALAFVRERLAG